MGLPDDPAQRNEPIADHDLMARSCAGDETAFTEVVRRHRTRLVALFRRLGADPHAAEDCTQETLLRLLRARTRYQPTAPFVGFLFALARQSWGDWLRAGARRQRLAGALERAPREPVDPTPTHLARLDLADAVTALPEGMRWVVVLSTGHGLSYEEIARVLDIPQGTVKSRMYHAVRRLREELGDDSQT